MDVDCFVAAYPPRRNLTFAGEVNVNGVYTHDEWREFMRWAVGHYDIIQSSTLPLSAPVAELYDWLTQVISPLTKSVSSDSICSSSFMRKLTDVDEATVCGSGRPYRGVV